MKCSKHKYGYEDLPIEGIDQPDTLCQECWAIYALNNSNGEIAPYNIDVLIQVLKEHYTATWLSVSK